MPDVINSEWGEQIKLHDLHLEGPFEGCRITKLIMHVAPSEHASMRIEAKLKLSEAKEWIYRELDGIPVTVKTIEGCIMFCGPIRNASISVSGGSCRIALELTSGSTFLELKEASCSYQDGNISYRQIMKETIQEIEGGAIIFPGIGEEVTGQPIIRYLETAWSFLTRLASHKGVPLVPDIHTTGAPRIFAGLPRIPEQSIMWEDRQIIQIHQDGRFLSLGGYEAGLDPLHFLMYDICDSKMFQIGQRGIIRGREMVVVGVDAWSYGGEVVFNYHVAMEQYCYVPRQNNHKISGMSLLGTVIGRAAEDIWLHLDIDGDRGSADNWGWPWTPPTGNFMYLMPKEGSRVSLYFSNADERSGKGINCIAQTSGGNPRERWLKTEHKKSLNLKEEEMSLVSENGGNSIKMYGTGVYFKGQEITLSGKSINIDGSKVKLKANVDTILIGVGPMEEGKEGGCQLEPAAFVGLEKNELNICGKARTLLEAEAGSEGNPPYPDGPQEGKWNFEKAAGRAAVTVVVIGGTAVVVCGSMGASTPVIAGAAVTAGMAGGGMMVSDAIQGKVSSLEDYALSVASAELMFFTNQAMTRLITVTGMGFVSGTVAKAAGEAAAGAALDYLVAGEVDYERLARNLVINVVVDLGTGVLTGEAWEKPRQRTIEGGSGSVSRGEYLRNKYGALTKEELNNRINLRQAVHDELDRLKASGLTKNEIGPMVAGIYDPKMDRYYFGINDLEGYLPSNLHPLLETRFSNMPESILNSYTKTRGAGSHAEIYALNEALWAREKAGIAANLDDLYLNVISARRVSKSIPVSGMPVPRCPHCEYLTEGIYFYPEVLKYGKNSH